jgi:hypothetical protein
MFHLVDEQIVRQDAPASQARGDQQQIGPFTATDL